MVANLYARNLPSLYFRTGIIDPYFNLFIFTSIYFGYLYLSNEEAKNKIHLVLSGIFAGLAPNNKRASSHFNYFDSLHFFLQLIRKLKIGMTSILVFFTTIIGCSLIWYGYEIWQSGPWFLVEFIKYQIELFQHLLQVINNRFIIMFWYYFLDAFHFLFLH